MCCRNNHLKLSPFAIKVWQIGNRLNSWDKQDLRNAARHINFIEEK